MQQDLFPTEKPSTDPIHNSMNEMYDRYFGGNPWHPQNPKPYPWVQPLGPAIVTKTTTGALLDKLPETGAAAEITQVTDALKDLLLYKNSKYGNSGLNPIKVFSKADAETGLLQRLDDKIARIQNSTDLRKNDVADVVGYLVLICVKKGWFDFSEFKD